MATAARQNDKKPTSLSDIFNQFAQESVRQFPAVKGKFLLYDTNENVSYGRKALSRSNGRTKSAVDEFLHSRASDKDRQTYADSRNRLKLLFIMYDEPVSKRHRKAVPKKLEKDILFILDHELAHLVIKDPPLAGENMQYKDSIKEAIADAYALIRHYQRYGTKSTHKNHIIDPWARAGALTLNNDAIHFSTLMLDEIIKRKDIIDFENLTAQQTGELARRFAVEYTPPAAIVNNIYDKLKPVQKAFYDEPSKNTWLKTLARVTLDPRNDPYTFRICKKILNGYLNGRKDMDGQSFNTTGVYWDKIRARLKKAEDKLNREDMLFNMPQKMQKNKERKNHRPPAA